MFRQAMAAASKLRGRHDLDDIQFGLKKTAGRYTGELSIRVQVVAKKPRRRLKPNQAIPSRIGKFITDVVEYSPRLQVRKEDPAAEVRPLLGGIEIQSCLFNQRINWGTLGYCFALGEEKAGITNYHVVFGKRSEEDAQQLQGRLGVFQPNKPNFGTLMGTVGKLFSREYDYCVFHLNGPSDSRQSVNNVAGIIDGFVHPLIGQELFKAGAATGTTSGILEARSLEQPSRIVIGYHPPGHNDSTYISGPGDSGAVWLARRDGGESLKVVALHYGGDRRRNVAFAILYSSIHASLLQKLKSTI